MAKSTYDYNLRRRKKRPNRTFEIACAILAVITIACAFSGNVDPKTFFPSAFMTLAFVPMLLLMLLLLVIALLWRRWLAVIALIVAIVITLPVITVFLPMNTAENAPAVPADPKAMLKVMTFNALMFNHHDVEKKDKPSGSMRMILDADPDVVMLQEGAADADWEELTTLKPLMAEVKAKYPYRFLGDEGLCIMSKFPFKAQTVGEQLGTRTALGYNRKQNAYLARSFDLELPSGKQLRLVDFRLQSYHLSFGKNPNVRVSPDVKPNPLERMRRSFALRSGNAEDLRHFIDGCPKNVIVCGDMNDVPTSHVYRVIKGDDLNDAWSDVGRGYAFTYNRHHLKYRIDHILYRGDLKAIRAERIKGGDSDHYPIMATFDIDIN